MECDAPGNLENVTDLCWLDRYTLIGSDCGRELLFKLTLNLGSKTCTYTELDSGYCPWRLGRSYTKQILVTDNLTNSSVKVYNSSGWREEWEPSHANSPRMVNMYRYYVTVISDKGPAFVYNRYYNYMYQVSLAGDLSNIHDAFLTHDHRIITTTGTDGHHLIISNMNDKTSVTAGGYGTADGQFDAPYGVGAVLNSILVGDFYNDRISVFNTDGEFIHHLRYVGVNVTRPKVIDVLFRGLYPSYLAVGFNQNIKIYTLTPE